MVDRLVAAAALVVLAPLMLVIGLAVRLDSPGPVLYGATRVGQGGRWFTLWKFRTMLDAPLADGPKVTVSGDARVTRVGRVLRVSKLDELPQLFNVARGEMRLVGWRPEDPVYFDGTDPVQGALLDHLPGITSPASISHRHEEQTLAAAVASGGDLDETYRQLALTKAAVDLEYLRRRNLRSDVGVLLGTGRSVLRRPPVDGAVELDLVYRAYRGDYVERWSWDRPGNRAIAEERETVATELLGPVAGTRVLDVGAGGGAGFPTLFPDAFRINLDLLPWRLELPGWGHLSTNHPAAAVVGDGRALPHPDGCIDVALLSVVLSSITESDGHQVLAEVRRVLRPGGFVLVYDFRVGNPRNSAVHAVSRRWIAAALPGFTIRARSVTLVPPLARRLRTLRWYRPLGRLRFTQTHNVVVGRRCGS